MNNISRFAVSVLSAVALVEGCSGFGWAQVPQPIVVDMARLSDARNVRLFNRVLTVTREDGRVVARLDSRAGDGSALVEGILLAEGIIEVDLKGRDVAQQSFLGIAFHVVDTTTFDAVYFRPFNFRAAAPEARSHAVQYVSHPAFTWHKLRAERTGQFEKAIEPPPDPDGWFHARIVLTAGRVEVYVNGAATPSLAVDDLGASKNGGVALFAGNNSDGAFANLRITPTSQPGPAPQSTQTIFQAAGSGNLPRVQALVEGDAKAALARNESGLTPLHYAARFNQVRVAEYLLEHGADPNAVARHAGTPLDLAAEAGSADAAKALEAKGGRLTPFRFEVTQLSPSIHRLAIPWGMMNNILVSAGPEGAVIVDTGFSKHGVDDLRKAIAGVAKGGVRYVISSHGHGDHVAGNAIAPSPDAIITAQGLASRADRFSMTRATEPLKGRTGRALPAPYLWRFGGADIRIIHRPGLHSADDLITWFPAERVVAMGDLLLSESMPALDDIAGYLAFLDDVLDVFPPDSRFVSGHGRDLTAEGVKAYRDTLTAMIGIIRTNLAAGRTPEQMVGDDVLRDYKSQYGLLDFLVPNTLIPRAVKALQGGQLR
jgi:glyoxylase-like metal-dependent hydrolase (beta-lactamase superfamily II)